MVNYSWDDVNRVQEMLSSHAYVGQLSGRYGPHAVNNDMCVQISCDIRAQVNIHTSTWTPNALLLCYKDYLNFYYKGYLTYQPPPQQWQSAILERSRKVQECRSPPCWTHHRQSRVRWNNTTYCGWFIVNIVHKRTNAYYLE